MKMLLKLLVFLPCTTVSLAQNPRLPPAPPPSSTVDAGSYPIHCAPGDLMPGPTCSSFYKCVWSLAQATRRVAFECAPGTVFSSELSACIHATDSKCETEGPTTRPIPPPPPQPPQSCPPYQLDPSSVYDCLEPGYFQSHRDCVSFYRCIVTMNCIIKGFLYRCPSGYLFNDVSKRCQKQELFEICQKVADTGIQTYEILPVGAIEAENLDRFFDVEVYWDFIPFLPNETQKIVPIVPSTFSRGAGERVYLVQN
nr:peritrophin-1-like [Cherax quadricarinatus]